MIHLYENHLGGYYTADDYNEYFLETCESCGDSDWYIGRYDTMEEVALELFKRDTSEEHILEVTGLKANVSFDVVTSMEEIALELYRDGVSEEHIESETGLKVNVRFEEAGSNEL